MRSYFPVSRGKWLVCPGWLIWPTRFGPGIRSRLKEFQIDPIKLERFLQQRTSAPEERPRIPYPQDNTLGEAVARMSEAAKADGKDKLVRSIEEWNTLVLTNMKSNNFNKFTKDITKWVGNVSSLDDLNRWLAMATNIWNNVPQPDRGNRTANEMVLKSAFSLMNRMASVKTLPASTSLRSFHATVVMVSGESQDSPA